MSVFSDAIFLDCGVVVASSDINGRCIFLAQNGHSGDLVNGIHEKHIVAPIWLLEVDVGVWKLSSDPEMDFTVTLDKAFVAAGSVSLPELFPFEFNCQSPQEVINLLVDVIPRSR